MILHVLFDDKFGDYVYEQFSQYDSICKIVLLACSNEPVRYVTKCDSSDVIIWDSDSYSLLIQSLGSYDAIVMHGLFSQCQYEIVRNMPQNVKLAWVVWGAEIYSRKEVFLRILSPVTKIFYKLHRFRNYLFSRNIDDSTIVPIDVLKRVDYALESSEEVFNDAKQYIGNSKLKFLDYSYYSLNSLIGEHLLDRSVYGKNILVGNSASVEGNHLDLFLRLKKNRSIINQKIYVPVSYGEPWVKNLVCKVGTFFWGAAFTPLREFLPRYEYNKVICSCSIVIMNHYRPNALGNILTALWVGCCVFVSNKNPQTKYLKRIGLHIFSIEDDLVNFDFDYLLPLEIVEDNRNIIKRIFGKEKNDIDVKNIIEVLDGNNRVC